VFGIVISLLLAVFQASQTGIVVGLVTHPQTGKPAQNARVALLSPKYTEVWSKQVQTRLDNYWEIFKPEFVAKKEQFLQFERMAQVEGFRYVTSIIRRDLGSDAASKFIRDTSPTGQFEITGIPFGTYQLLVHATIGGQDVVWSKSIDVQTDVPLFVDLGKPVS